MKKIFRIFLIPFFWGGPLVSLIQFILIALILFFCCSCATICSGVKCKVKIRSGDPAAAKVLVNGNYSGTTPITIKVSKNGLKNGQTVVTIQADGYLPQEIILTRKIKIAALVGDIIFTGGIGLIVDFATGAIYKSYPGEINYKLEKK